MDKLPITKAGEKDLAEKLRQLKTKDRPEIAQAIAEARAHGDLKENAEYHAAKEQQGFIEAKIQEIEHALANAQVIDVKDIPETGRVVFGATIDLYDLLTRDQREQIADIMMEAMEDNYIFPEIWEMKVEAIIDSERATA